MEVVAKILILLYGVLSLLGLIELDSYLVSFSKNYSKNC